MDAFQIMLVVILGLGVVSVIIGLAVFAQLFQAWMRVKLAGGQVTLIQIVSMRLNGVPINLIVDAYLVLLYRGTPKPMQLIEKCYLAHPGMISDREDLIRWVENEPDSADVK